MYFRYPSPAASDGDQRSVSHQLVQCVYKKTSYPSPIQVKYPFSLEILRACWLIQTVTYLSHLGSHVRAAPEGGGNKVLGSRRRVRPPLRLPGRAVWAEGRRRALRLRLLPDHGQRRRFLQLLRRLPPGPLRGREGRKKKEQMRRWMDKWVGWRLLTIRWLEMGHLDVGCWPGSWSLNVCLDGYSEGWKDWGLKASLEGNAARGWSEREKKGRIFPP